MIRKNYNIAGFNNFLLEKKMSKQFYSMKSLSEAYFKELLAKI